MENYNEKLEQSLLDMVEQKQQADRRLLSLEIVIGVFSGIILFSLIMLVSFVQMADWLWILLIFIGIISFAVGMAYAIRIEQTAGYYECARCGHKYVPTYGSVLWAMHVNRTRYMRCPKCGKRSWNKKVL